MQDRERSDGGGYLSLVRSNRDFRMLWFGQIVSLLGDWFNLIASAALLAELTGSGLAIGGLFVVRMLAPFLVSPVAGVAADRYNRKRILVGCDLIRALVVLGFLFVRDPSHVWLLYLLTGLQLGISGFFYPARNALLTDIVQRGDLGAANAISSATWSVMLALGAGLGGIVSGTWGIYQAFLIDSATFLVSAAFIVRISSIGSRTPGGDGSRFLKRYVEGLSYLVRNPDILLIALHKAAAALFVSSGFQVVQVSIAKNVFPLGKAGGISLGLMFGLAGVGTGIGPILARRFTADRDVSLRRAILFAYFLSALGLILISPLSSFEMVLAGTFVRGIGGGIIWVFSTQLLLQLVPNRVLGRVFSTEFAIFTLMSAAGAWTAGFAVDSSLGLEGTTQAMAALTLIPAGLWGLWMLRRRLPVKNE